ncbi:aminotransferase class III-fold pyridoxal phosphate-dependent enzyme [Pseudomonas aeruginosa]
MSAPHAQVERADFDRYMVPNYAPAAFIPVRGEGSRVWDQSGRELIDFAGGIAVTSLGHAHPALVKALTEQAQRIWHVSNVFTNEPALRLARKLVDATFAERVFLANSGAEANEGGLQAGSPLRQRCLRPAEVRDHRRQQQLPRAHPVHPVNVGGQPKYSDGFGPKFEGITHVPYNDLEALKAAISEQDLRRGAGTDPGRGRRAAGAAGLPGRGAQAVRRAQRGCWSSTRSRAAWAGSARLFAYMHYGVVPDILSSAKSLGGGFPIGAMLTTGEIAKHLSVGTHGTTYGGNPLASAVAEAALDVINTPEVLDGVKAPSMSASSPACRRSARSTASSTRSAAWAC